MKTLVKTYFKESWCLYINSSQKLDSYRNLKSSFGKECYLDHVIRYNDRANTTRLRLSEDRICTWRSTIFSAHTVENKEHLLNHCDINAVARRNILNKINIITSKSSDRTPNSTIHTISPDTNLVNLISNHNDILISPTYKSQIHLSMICPAITKTFWLLQVHWTRTVTCTAKFSNQILLLF